MDVDGVRPVVVGDLKGALLQLGRRTTSSAR
jgi:hypothetical protein